MSKQSGKIRKQKHVRCSVVVVAAGNCTRFGRDKILEPLAGKSVLEWSLSAFEQNDSIDEIILVTHAERMTEIADECVLMQPKKLKKIVRGGDTRTKSALAGAVECAKNAEIILIHDAARPLVSQEIIDGAVHVAILYGAAAPAIAVKDTIKLVQNGIVDKTIPRENLRQIQTPQAFNADIIKGALTSAVQNELQCSDDCAAAEAIGARIHLTEGSEENIKITTPIDIDIASAILSKREAAQ